MEDRGSYEKLQAALLGGSPALRDAAVCKYFMMTKMKDESFDHYVSRVTAVVEKAYPVFARANCKQLIRDRFVFRLSRGIRFRMLSMANMQLPAALGAANLVAMTANLAKVPMGGAEPAEQRPRSQQRHNPNQRRARSGPRTKAAAAAAQQAGVRRARLSSATSSAVRATA